MKSFKWIALLFLMVWNFSLFGQSQPEIFSNESGAINGYDPVAYFGESKPVKGSDSLTYQWKDAAWHFSSQKNLQAFKSNPDKYAPQFGGYCAFGMSRGYKAKTLPETWTVIDGKLYLNYNMDVKKEWSKTPEVYIEKANKNWIDVKKK
jgi:YHS domain-containing protein